MDSGFGAAKKVTHGENVGYINSCINLINACKVSGIMIGLFLFYLPTTYSYILFEIMMEVSNDFLDHCFNNCDCLITHILKVQKCTLCFNNNSWSNSKTINIHTGIL